MSEVTKEYEASAYMHKRSIYPVFHCHKGYMAVKRLVATLMKLEII